jgi:hypothetical protein
MSILNETRHTGVQLPRTAFSYLTLYALSKGTTRTQILREIVEDWISNQSEQDLLSGVVEKVRRKWILEKANTPHLGAGRLFEEFKIKLKKELQKKEIEEDKIDLILNNLNSNGKT